MDIKRSGSRPSGKGPAEYFTGNVRIDPLFEAPDPHARVAQECHARAGARSAWYTMRWAGHSCRVRVWWVQSEDAQRWKYDRATFHGCPPKEKHWHGATPTTATAISPFRNSSTAKSSSGWKRSATNNTRRSSPPERGGKSLCAQL